MRMTSLRLSFFFAALFLGTFAIGQNLTPQELIQINTSPNPVISSTLVGKGFQKSQDSQLDERTKETISSWYFGPFFIHSGELVSSYVTKSVDTSQKTKTVFLLYNPFHYRDFIQNLALSKYRFTGMQIVNSEVYTVFENKRAVFMTIEKDEKGARPVFKIIVKAK